MSRTRSMKTRRPGPRARLVTSDRVVLREEFDDWAVLFDPDTGVALGINPAGAAVWRLLDGSRSLEEALCEVRATFSGVPVTGMAELEAFVGDLLEARLVQVVGAEGDGPENPA